MYNNRRVCVLIPARDEAPSIGAVIRDLQRLGLVDRIVVCDNGSRDATADIAGALGASVVHEARPGYGAACSRALSLIESTDIVAFVDADGSLRVAELPALLDAIVDGADLAIGTRRRQWREPGSMSRVQILGNWLASRLIRCLWRQPVTDLGPFRAIRFARLCELDMRDRRCGWTVEMQVKAIQQGLKWIEVPVHFRRRIGKSRISGSLRGVFIAGVDIIGTILRLALKAENPATPVARRRVRRR